MKKECSILALVLFVVIAMTSMSQAQLFRFGGWNYSPRACTACQQAQKACEPVAQACLPAIQACEPALVLPACEPAIVAPCEPSVSIVCDDCDICPSGDCPAVGKCPCCNNIKSRIGVARSMTPLGFVQSRSFFSFGGLLRR